MGFAVRWSEQELAAHQKRRAPPAESPKTGRIKGTQRQVDPETGKKVASKRELTRLQSLRMLFRAGEIDVLATQVWFRLEGARYEADAVFGRVVMIDGVPHLRMTVEDAKGMRTDVYRQKARQMRERYGIEVQET